MELRAKRRDVTTRPSKTLDTFPNPRAGREYHITLVEKPLHDAAEWATKTAEFWEQRLEQLEQYLNPDTKR